MLSKQEQAKFRSRLFRHLDGIVTAPSAFELHDKGVTKFLLEKKKVSLTEIAEKFKANDGYLHVALKTLCSQGWLIQHLDNAQNTLEFEVNERSEEAFANFELYRHSVELMRLGEKYHNRKFELEPFLKLEKVFAAFRKEENKTGSEILDQILAHIEGIILGPTLVHLGMSGMFHKYFMLTRFKAEEFHEDAESFGRLLDILAHFGFFKTGNGSYEFTEKGLFFAKRASAYGVTVSYIPTLRKLDELIFGNAKTLKAGEGDEQHVDREMNVWGSGGAHASYFKIIDQIIIDLFNRPIEEQPKGILDMGCGNGAFLIHLFNVIDQQTLRGQMLDEHPLMLIGVDYNEAALRISRANLIQADVWAKIIWGDIGDPELLAKDLEENYNIDLKEVLNVRTFLDHNRIWKDPDVVDARRPSTSTGAFAFEGQRKDNNAVSESLREHFRNWTPFVKKFGLLLVELHTVDPALVAENVGKTAATAYDATHGYSDQYIVEIEEFVKCIEEVGLIQQKEHFRRFPDSDLATISINLFKSPD
jgi:SAM-dependent methyltransferase/DNA-binding MarR family transcriptional regulator